MACVLADHPIAPPNLPDPGCVRPGLLIFCAEQGFAGPFSERVLDSLGAGPGLATVFLIGTRGLSIATARGLTPQWTAPLPSRTPGIPKLADQITTAIYTAVAGGQIDCLDVVFTTWHTGRTSIVRRRLFPLDLADLPVVTTGRPLMQLPDDMLLAALGQDYFNAQVCKAALHAFTAENEARMAAMTAASSQITQELETFRTELNRVRQEAITAEIMELGTGVASAHAAR
jgi:F-type H+-transporting ATPase subunit gamma